MTQRQIGQIVSFGDVLTQYRYDFAFGSRPDLLARFDAGASDTEKLAILTELKKPTPPIGLTWRYESLTADIVSVACLPWKGLPPVPDLVARMETVPFDQLDKQLNTGGTPAKIQRLAVAPDCGTSLGYRHAIIVKDKPAQGQYRVLEGSHRLCALWLRFADNWPEGLGVYVGSKN